MSSNEREQARAYVKMLRRQGHTDEDIRQIMLEDDWEEDELEAVWQHLDVAVPSATAPEPASATDAAHDPVPFVREEIARWRDEGLISGRVAQRLLAEYEAEPAPAPTVAPEEAWPRIRIPITPGMVLLYIGGLVIFIAGLILATNLWPDLGPSGRFALVLLPTVGLYAGGVRVHLTDPDRRVAAAVMLFFACLLLPFLLLLGAGWLLGEDALDNPTMLVLAMATLAIHVATLYFFRSPLLTIPYPLSLAWFAIQIVIVVAPERYGPSANAIAATLIVSGLVLLAIGMYHAQQRKRAYAVMPDLIGAFCLLAGLVTLGAGGHYPAWEFLSFVVSLGLIAGSVYQKNQIYLLAGAVFLTINIFSIGFEYFGESAGLPLTLLICGALSMGAGYMAHRVRKEHIVRPRRP